MATKRLVLVTESLAVGRFRCPPGDVRWQRENWIGPRHHIVFPSRSVLIEQDGRGSVLADPNQVVLYDAGRTYRRELVSPEGDRAVFVAVSEPLVRDLLGQHGEAAPRFGRSEVALPADSLLRLHLLLNASEHGTLDPLDAEEVMLGLLEPIVAQTATPSTRPSIASRRGTHRAHDDLILDTKRVLSQRLADPLSLAQIGRLVGSSPFHLARLFRAGTGSSMHAYREQIRLRSAMERITEQRRGGSLAWLAAEFGFASHAYFDTRFRRTFGRSPSSVRAAAAAHAHPSLLRASLLDEMRTITQGGAAARA